MKNSHYRSLNLVGEGQFGKVYTAIHRQTGELVALKEFNPEKFSTKKFLREMRILLSLEHPNIVCCQGIEHNSRGRHLVIEYCEGGTLRDLLETEVNLTIEQKLKLITDILDGLNYAHTQGIIHRDLKPENILLSVIPQGWRAKISDFGVAKIELEDKELNISTMGDTGSPAYMAPEQFYGKYSYSSDIYSMGIMLYELLIGNRPFSGSPHEIMVGHLNHTPQFPENLPSSLELILKKALQKLPQHRFRTAQEMKTTILNATLELQSQNLSLYDQIPQKIISFDLVYQEFLEEYINFLTVKDNFIYQSNSQTLMIENYQEDNHDKISLKSIVKHQLNNKLIDIQTIDSGCIVNTRNLSDYNKYSLLYCNVFNGDLKILINIESEYLTYGVAHNNNWFAISKRWKDEQSFQVIKTKTLIPITPLIKDFFPQQIIAIDSRHGLVIYHQREINKNQTFFRFFNRRGSWQDSYNVSLSLDKIVHHQGQLKTFLTKEKQTDNLVFIKFEPFAVHRIPLGFKASFWLPSPWGFLCANLSGNIALLDFNGNYLGETNIKKTIKAIAPLNKDKIIVITQENNQQKKEIYQIKI
ncbi:protein kinase domain-containing protein [Geminocystis sp. GBBB08]|uniref:serine/threonine-protein kinase n=1 Tax=Geminocystis sp. GBBB08 TaxID=2604140 RepID=UPI0027E24612|nr:protein kinase [Geminocystis sp. GBBB08]MBL1208591.1 protein kinase [Geminocystis sp. GBBB08]